jgi:hypothetical protein
MTKKGFRIRTRNQAKCYLSRLEKGHDLWFCHYIGLSDSWFSYRHYIEGLTVPTEQHLTTLTGWDTGDCPTHYEWR